VRSTSVYWLNAGPALSGFHQPLLQSLHRRGYTVRQWTLYQSEDEALTVADLLGLLQETLAGEEQPVHLAAHGSAGLLALRYAQAYAQQVASVSLLSVGPNPWFDWQYCYYTLLRSCQSDRLTLLRQLAQQLFGAATAPRCQRALYRVLEADLSTSCSASHLLQGIPTDQIELPVPLWCGTAADDLILRMQVGTASLIHPQQSVQSEQWPGGGHCFHYCDPRSVAQSLDRFWKLQAAPLIQPTAAPALEVTR
jgi:pimeloyl-ACP methyl ester carboxylesterase